MSSSTMIPCSKRSHLLTLQMFPHAIADGWTLLSKNLSVEHSDIMFGRSADSIAPLNASVLHICLKVCVHRTFIVQDSNYTLPF